MSKRIVGLLVFAVGLAALVAGSRIVALVSAATGLLFIASTVRTGRGGSGDSHWYGDDRNGNHDVGGNDGDSGGGAGVRGD